jgi:hypothetical protein
MARFEGTDAVALTLIRLWRTRPGPHQTSREEQRSSAVAHGISLKTLLKSYCTHTQGQSTERRIQCGCDQAVRVAPGTNSQQGTRTCQSMTSKRVKPAAAAILRATGSWKPSVPSPIASLSDIPVAGHATAPFCTWPGPQNLNEQLPPCALHTYSSRNMAASTVAHMQQTLAHGSRRQHAGVGPNTSGCGPDGRQQWQEQPYIMAAPGFSAMLSAGVGKPLGSLMM